jgi:hypothetical protein
MSDSTDKGGSVRLGWGQVAAILTAIVGGAMSVGGLWWQVEALEARIRDLSDRIDKALLQGAGGIPYDRDPSEAEDENRPGKAAFTGPGRWPSEGVRSVGGRSIGSAAMQRPVATDAANGSSASANASAGVTGPAPASQMSWRRPIVSPQRFVLGHATPTTCRGRAFDSPIIHVTDLGVGNFFGASVLSDTRPSANTAGGARIKRAGADGCSAGRELVG